MSRFNKVLLLLILLVSCVTSLGIPSKATAVTGANWNPGRIIDDEIFFNPGGMDTGIIQNFLNSKVPACDTWGNQPYSGWPNRGSFGTSRGYPPPYTCLKDYRQDTPSRGAEANLCNAYSGGNKSAAQIINDVSQACSINPKVLLVLLQKEQTLVTDDWPWDIQYRSAMGYGCPDTAPCDAEYYGFFNQVYNSARQFKRYARDETIYRYKRGRENYIQYNPNSACGGSNVFIQNQATAGLYNYTPYQPNTSALNNLYGEGDGCGAYGNRNFWRLFNDWFGSTILDCQSGEPSQAQVTRAYDPKTYKHFYTTYNCELGILSAKLGYKIEGTAFYQQSQASPYLVRVHRLYNPTNQQHLWTAYQADIDSAITRSGYHYEGVAFYATQDNTPNAFRVHRLYNPNTQQHLWTAYQADIDSAIKYAGYHYEGVAFWAFPPP